MPFLDCIHLKPLRVCSHSVFETLAYGAAFEVNWWPHRHFGAAINSLRPGVRAKLGESLTPWEHTAMLVFYARAVMYPARGEQALCRPESVSLLAGLPETS